MSPSIIVSCFVLIAALCGSSTEAVEQRIINGALATAGQYPYTVSLQLIAGTVHICGGSILNNRWILTSAHCLEGVTAATIQVAAGTLTYGAGGTIYPVTNFIKHPSYVTATRIYDVAIVHTTTTIAFTALVQPVVLLSSSIAVGTPGVISGWGFTTPVAPFSPNLKSLSTNTLSNTDCTNRLLNSATVRQTTHFCTFITQAGACTGDEGSPIVLGGAQFGIVSFTNCNQGLPDLHTTIQRVYIWILTNAV